MNELHTFLSAGNVQARPVIGQTFELGNQDDLTGFFSPMDEKTAFELGGTMAEMDRLCVVDRSLIDAGNEPAVNQLVEIEGVQMEIRAIKIDQSSYLLGLSMLDAEADPDAAP